MLELVFDLPFAMSVPVIVGTLCFLALAGRTLVRRRVRPRLRIRVEASEFSEAMVQSVIVFYGLAVGLIAVNVSQTYSETSSVVAGEAIALNALYRDVTNDPEPIRSELQRGLSEYTEQVIQQAWPLQRAGRSPALVSN